MSATLALATARTLAGHSGSRIAPVDGTLPDDAAGAVLLVDRTPDETLLAQLADGLADAQALVMWCEGWDEPEAVAQLGRCGLEHGTVEVLDGERSGALCVLVADERAAARLPDLSNASTPPFRALAIMPVHNEADLIEASLAALISEGVDVYLIDHESTDDTVALANRWLGRGLERIERFPEDAGYPARNHGTMVWRDILSRVQEVSGEQVADWYLFVNADEFREAPWLGTTLGDGLREVDALGYSAVNFELFDFRAIDDGYVSGSDPRAHFTHYEPGARFDRLQVKAWKRQPAVVDLVSQAGHDVGFPGRRVFPVPFVLRHYAIRSSEHGRRKVLHERLPRFSAAERASGMHIQYDHLGDGATFLHDPVDLAVWDAGRIRAELLSRASRDLLLGVQLSGADGALGSVHPERLRAHVARGGFTGDIQSIQARLAAAAQGRAVESDRTLDAPAGELARALSVGARLAGDLRGSGQIDDAAAALKALGTRSLPAPAPVAA